MKYLSCAQVWMAYRKKMEGCSVTNDEPICLVNQTDSYRMVCLDLIFSRVILFHIYTKKAETQSKGKVSHALKFTQ